MPTIAFVVVAMLASARMLLHQIQVTDVLGATHIFDLFADEMSNLTLAADTFCLSRNFEPHEACVDVILKQVSKLRVERGWGFVASVDEQATISAGQAEPDDFSMQQSMMDEDLRQLADNIGAKQQFLQTLDQSEAEYEQLRQYYAQQVEAKNLVIQQTKQEMSKLLEAIESVEANRHEEKSRLSKDYEHKVLFLERQVPPTPKALFGPRRYRAGCVMAGAVALRKGARTRQTAATER